MDFAACGVRRFTHLRRQPSSRISWRGSSAGTSRSRRWAGCIRKPQGISPASHGATGHEQIALGASRPALCSFANTKGERHTVTVVANGFVWREATYASLSTIARAITGTNWNGPRFFGLRIDRETIISPDAADVPPAEPNGRSLARRPSLSSSGPLAYNGPSRRARPAEYIGEVAYRGEVHRGEHEPILGRDVLEAVQEKFAANAITRKVRLRGSAALLTGRLVDDRGNSMTPTHANKKGVRYRYYVSQALLQNRKAEAGSIARIPIVTHRELTPRRPDCLADEAVSGEPVSEARFPANREKNREFRENRAVWQKWQKAARQNVAKSAC